MSSPEFNCLSFTELMTLMTNALLMSRQSKPTNFVSEAQSQSNHKHAQNHSIGRLDPEGRNNNYRKVEPHQQCLGGLTGIPKSKDILVKITFQI